MAGGFFLNQVKECWRKSQHFATVSDWSDYGYWYGCHLVCAAKRSGAGVCRIERFFKRTFSSDKDAGLRAYHCKVSKVSSTFSLYLTKTQGGSAGNGTLLSFPVIIAQKERKREAFLPGESGQQ